MRVDLVITAAVLVLAGTSAAAWPLTGSGAAKAKAGAIAGNRPDATQGAPTSITLSWVPTPGATGYIVARSGGIGAIGGTCTGTIHGTSCTDTPVLPLTTYSYTVTPTAGTWTGSASPPRAIAT